jgi:hypothetical protein
MKLLFKNLLFIFGLGLLVFNLLAVPATAQFVPQHWVVGTVNDAANGTMADGRTVSIWPALEPANVATDIIGATGRSGTANRFMLNAFEIPNHTLTIGETLVWQVIPIPAPRGDDYGTDQGIFTVNGFGVQDVGSLTLQQTPTGIAPVVRIFSPSAGNVLRNGVTYTISWEVASTLHADVRPADIVVEYTVTPEVQPVVYIPIYQAGMPGYPVVNPNTGSIAWTVPNLWNYQPRVMVRVRAWFGGEPPGFATSETFAIDNTAPAIAVSYPSPGLNFSGGDTIVVSFEAQDNHSANQNLRFSLFYSLNNGDDGYPYLITSNFTTTEVLDNRVRGRYRWICLGTAATLEAVRLRVLASDEAGNNASANSASFSIFGDQVAPVATSIRASPTSFSPEGDGVADTTRFTVVASDAATSIASFEIYVNGQRALAASRAPTTETWTGYTTLGDQLQNGTYKIEVRVWDFAGNTAMATTESGVTLAAAPLKSSAADATAFNNGRRVVRDSLGTVHVVYHSAGEIFYVSTASNGVSWNAPLNLSNSYTFASRYPSIAADSNNDVYAVWQELGSRNTADVYYRKRAYNSGSPTWEAKVLLRETALNTANAYPVIDANTSFRYVIWQEFEAAAGRYDIYFRAGDANGWGSVINVSNSAAANSLYPSAALDSDGALNIVYKEGNSTINFVKTSDRGSSFGSAASFFSGSEISDIPSIAVDSSKNIYVVWSQYNAADLDHDLFYSFYNNSTRSWLPAPLSARGTGNSRNASLGIAPNQVYLVWSEAPAVNGNDSIFFSSSSGGAFAAGTALSSSEIAARHPNLNKDTGSRTELVWSELNTINNNYDIRYHYEVNFPPRVSLIAFLNGYYDAVDSRQSRPATLEIEVRTAQTAVSVVTRSTFEVSSEGTAIVSFEGIDTGQYYLVFKQSIPGQRAGVNHLPVITRNPITLEVGANLSLNISNPNLSGVQSIIPIFTPTATTGSYASAMRTEANGMLSLRTGDADGNGYIDDGDLSLFMRYYHASSYEASVDFDGNGILDDGDYSVFYGNFTDLAGQNIREYKHTYVTGYGD